MAPGRKIAIVTCSARPGRINPLITAYVHKKMTPLLTGITLETLDISSFNLPVFDETVIPARMPAEDPTPHYSREHTRAWSAAVRGYDGFVFVTPQYNWSVPASLKNALDYLFYEWKGKPAGIVSYGGQGGGKSAAHLRDILTGLRMRPMTEAPGLSLTGEMMANCQLVEADELRWKEAGLEEKLESVAKELAQELSKE